MMTAIMKDQFKIMVVIILALVIPLSVICCCFHKSLAKNIQPSPGHCHSSHSAQKDPSAPDDCRCLKNLDLGSRPYEVYQTQAYSLYKHLSGNIVKLFADLPDVILFSFSSFPNRPPPRLAAAGQPIYLKLSVLRI